MQTKDIMDMVSSRMDKLKLQAEKLSTILSGKLNELGVECFQALSSGTKNAHPMVAFRLNSAAEFIHVLFSKVEDFCQLSKEDESEIQTGPGMKTSLLELAERIEVLEKSTLAVQTGDDDKKHKQKELEAKCDNLASETSLRMNSFETQLYDVISDLETVKQTLTSVSSDVKICIKKDEENEKKMEKFDENVKYLASVSSELKDCNERIKSLQSDVDGVEIQVEDLASVSIKVDESSTRIDKLESKLSCIEHVVEDLGSISTTVGDCKKRVNNLQSKVCCVENAVENVDRGNRKMKEQLKKVSANQTRLKKTVEEKEDLSKQAQYLLTKKIYKLETLQDVLGELKLRADTKDKSMEDTVTATQSQVLELKDSYDTLSTQITKVSGAPVGFNASLRERGTEVMPNSQLRGIWKAAINKGDCFKLQEGHFLAPRDGLYGFYVRVKQKHDVDFKLYLISDEGWTLHTSVKRNSQHSALYVRYLSGNKRVYLKVGDNTFGEEVTLDSLHFCGWSIGYH